MSQKYIEEFRGDLKEFHEMTKKFYQKDINVAQYKKFSALKHITFPWFTFPLAKACSFTICPKKRSAR